LQWIRDRRNDAAATAGPWYEGQSPWREESNVKEPTGTGNAGQPREGRKARGKRRDFGTGETPTNEYVSGKDPRNARRGEDKPKGKEPAREEIENWLGEGGHPKLDPEDEAQLAREAKAKAETAAKAKAKVARERRSGETLH
jgi:hypothetical protein